MRFVVMYICWVKRDVVDVVTLIGLIEFLKRNLE